MDKIYAWFERLTVPFPTEEPQTPPAGFVKFCWHYCKPMWPWLLFLGLMGMGVAAIEIYLFAFIGNVVEWLSTANRETFLQDNRDHLIWMGFVILVGFPIIILIWSILLHQVILGNFPMHIRWMAHRDRKSVV